MNTNNVKKYAPKARKAFIEAMSKQAAKYGITKKKIEPAEQKGDLVLIGDRPFPASVIKPRERLVKRIEQQGFDQVMEHVAYSWFNRLCAIRYMELKGFLDHGRRVLSSVEGSAADGSAGVPQILEECLDVELPGLDQTKVRELKLDGTKDEELYRELLLAQCHALNQAMPFLFEAVADESELLLPENLTKTDSLIRDLVASVPDEDWDHIEIIGWLYQFYISEKKDQVIGKVVKNEDIPAATQLFTPNWIVQYLVQNSVGRQWLQKYPDSPLKEKMPYYIEPAEQTPEVQAGLAAIIPKDLKPETLSCIDPAVGSGHLLIEAYKVFKAIYEERGYRTRDIPQLILENNLFGLDIDDRAGQLAGFALMMLAREDDRRIFSRNIRLNVFSLQESSNVNLPSLWRSLNLTGEWQSGTSQGLFEEEQQDLSAFAADNRYQLLQRTLQSFKQAKTFGSLIDVPHDDLEGLRELFVTLIEIESAGDTMQRVAAIQLLPYVHQAVLLAQKYNAVVANPPYMGGKYLNKDLKAFATKEYKRSSSDLYAVATERFIKLIKRGGYCGLMTPFTWMFLSSFEGFRKNIHGENTLYSLVQPQYHTFFESAAVPVCAFIVLGVETKMHVSSFIKLTEFRGAELQPIKALEAINDHSVPWFYTAAPDDFKSIPNQPVAYWVPLTTIQAFSKYPKIGARADAKQGLITGDNDRFLKNWHEVPIDEISFDSRSREDAKSTKKKWFPFQKGGAFRKWYGNHQFIVNWENDGDEIRNFVDENGKLRSRPQSMDYYFKGGVTWTSVTISTFHARLSPPGFIYSEPGPILHTDVNLSDIEFCAFLNSSAADYLLQLVAPAMHFNQGHISELIDPYGFLESKNEVVSFANILISSSKRDWDTQEVSWDFQRNVLLKSMRNRTESMRDTFLSFLETTRREISEFKTLEENINRQFIKLLGLESEVDAIVPIEKVSLLVNPQYRYDGPLDESLAEARFRSDVFAELLSYSLGCMLGRYSLETEGLVFAGSGNEGFADIIVGGEFDAFPADDDGIIPLTDQEWFPDDATNRFREFVKVVWGEEHLHENLDFVAESLCLHAIKPKKSESSMDTIRRYLSTQFYKDHLKTYKKRPIYWLFSSGKQKAFECLVYLHRYNEGTLARMRTEYVIPLTAKMAAYAQKLESDKEASGSAAEVKRFEKEIAQLHKQQAELSEFDEKLRHYADQRISLDLDDGVKVNYGRFGDLLADVKGVTGQAPEVLA